MTTDAADEAGRLERPAGGGGDADGVVLDVQNVGKRYGRNTALRDVSFQVRRGEVIEIGRAHV